MDRWDKKAGELDRDSCLYPDCDAAVCLAKRAPIAKALRDAYREGQRDMKERAAGECNDRANRWHERADRAVDYPEDEDFEAARAHAAETLWKAVRALSIEEGEPTSADAAKTD